MIYGWFDESKYLAPSLGNRDAKHYPVYSRMATCFGGMTKHGLAKSSGSSLIILLVRSLHPTLFNGYL